MKKFNFILAALVMLAAGCSKQEFKEAVQENHTSVITLQATMPKTTDEESATRATYESDGATVSGIVMKWTATDKLKLCFKKGGSYYHKDAEIDAASISTDGKTATFTWEMPDEINDGDTFDFYAVYQRKHPIDAGSGYFNNGTTNYEIVTDENYNVTLNQTGTYGAGIINPMLLFSAKNTTKAQLGTLKLNLEHIGWLMALHLKNSTGAEMDLPRWVEFMYPAESATSFIWNGYHYRTTDVIMDVATGTVTSSVSNWKNKACVRFSINDSESCPLYGQKLATGTEKVFYRWVVSTPQIESMQGKLQLTNYSEKTSTNSLPGRTVEKGKVYHTFLNWDGTTLTVTKRDGTPLP